MQNAKLRIIFSNDSNDSNATKKKNTTNKTI